jgi:hypothetical protein
LARRSVASLARQSMIQRPPLMVASVRWTPHHVLKFASLGSRLLIIANSRHRAPMTSVRHAAGSGRVLLVLCGSKTLLSRITLAHVGASLCISVVPVSAEMINPRTQVRPYDSARRAMSFSLCLRRKLVCARCAHAGCWRRTRSSARSNGRGRWRRVWGRCRASGGFRSTTSALSYAGCFRNTFCLILGLLRLPLCPAFLDRFLLGQGAVRCPKQ